MSLLRTVGHLLLALALIANAGLPSVASAADHAAHDRNFGGQTLIWDRLLGTLRLPEPFPEGYGAADPVPSDYLRQLAWPFLGLFPRKGYPAK